MSPTKKVSEKVARRPKPSSEHDRRVCFVISPIGDEGTERHTRFKDVLNYIIKSAVKTSGYELEVIRADEIDRTGSFIKDILESLSTSFVVIADLTEQNPNVFYELGVRHALSPRTILIAQSIDDIPSDLREYRTIVYDTSAKGAAEFAKRLKTFLSEIQKEPERPDNPVLDRIGSIFDGRFALLEAENQKLKNQLETILKKGVPKPKPSVATSVDKRVNRILQLMNAKEQILSGSFSRGEESFTLPTRQGNFKLYFVKEGNTSTINEMWYLSSRSGDFDYEDDLADVRVLMEKCIQQGGTSCKFVFATGDDLTANRKNITSMFNKMQAKLSPQHREKFDIEIWDDKGLTDVEKNLGLKI
jgi:hypothetical protein